MKRLMGIGLGIALAAATVIGLPATASAHPGGGYHGSSHSGSFRGGSAYHGGYGYNGGYGSRGGWGLGVSVNPYYAAPAYYYGYGCSPYYSPYSNPYCAY